MKHFLLSVLFVLTTFAGFSQCPPNIDFEQNNFSGWFGRSGTITNNSNAIQSLTSTGLLAGRHMLTSLPSPALTYAIPFNGTQDPYGLFPVVSPLGGSFCKGW